MAFYPYLFFGGNCCETFTRYPDDIMSTDSFGPVKGMQVNYSTADPDDAKRVYDALADGGQATQPLMETFFSPAFGMVTDRFGTPWMVVAESPEQPG